MKKRVIKFVLLSGLVCLLNFDLEIDRTRFRAAAALPPADALHILGKPDVLVIDEAQRMPEVTRIIKGWYDSRVSAKILLLGSSSLDLQEQAAESLTGRNQKLVLPPLLFQEVLESQSWFNERLPLSEMYQHFSDPIRTLLMQRLVYGSYPEAVTTASPAQLLRELSSDYLWKDILQIGLVRSLALIKRLLLLLAHQAGGEVSVNKLATQLQMARPTVERYLELLEQTFVIFRLSSFSTNPRKEIVKSKKIYFWDTGIRNALLNQFSEDSYRSDIGALWENWVIAEVAKQNVLLGNCAELYFWRTRAQPEVDLVIRQNETLRAIEIKWNPRRKAGRAFRDAYGIEVETVGPKNIQDIALLLLPDHAGNEKQDA